MSPIPSRRPGDPLDLRPRTPAGVPTGGQFAASQRAEGPGLGRTATYAETRVQDTIVAALHRHSASLAASPSAPRGPEQEALRVAVQVRSHGLRSLHADETDLARRAVESALADQSRAVDAAHTALAALDDVDEARCAREHAAADPQPQAPAVPTRLPEHSAFVNVHTLADLDERYETLTSPENLYADGERTTAQAEAWLYRLRAERRFRFEEIMSAR